MTAATRAEGFARIARWIAVRPLVVLPLLVACSNDPPPPPGEASAPAIAISAKCPIGDFTNVAVYGFLERELADAAASDEGRARTRELVAHEAKLLGQRDMKPPRASIVEGEMSHALGTLCDGTPGCTAVGLYNRSGLAIALSSRNGVIAAPLGFPDDARWAALRGAKLDPMTETAVLAITPAEAAQAAVDAARHVYVVAPVEHGVALCIVER